MSFRHVIARWLCPEWVADSDRLHRLQAIAVDAYRWLGEFPDAADTVRWLLDGDYNENRPLGAPAKGYLPASIWDYREYLRRRAADLPPPPVPK